MIAGIHTEPQTNVQVDIDMQTSQPTTYQCNKRKSQLNSGVCYRNDYFPNHEVLSETISNDCYMTQLINTEEFEDEHR